MSGSSDVYVLILQLVYTRADFRFAPSQRETALLCNKIFRWLGASLESVLIHYCTPTDYVDTDDHKPMTGVPDKWFVYITHD